MYHSVSVDNFFACTFISIYSVILHMLYSGTSMFTATSPSIIDTNNIRFPTVLTNQGNDYNSSSGVFTCRIAGQYWFSASIAKSSSNNVGYTYCFIMINGSHKMQMRHYEVNPLHAIFSKTASAGFLLNRGDRVQVGDCINPGFLYNGGMESFFSGVLIKPDV